MTAPPQPDWAVSTATERLTLNEQHHAETTVTVTNLHTAARSVTLAIATDDVAKSWFTIADPVRSIDGGGSAPFKIDVAVPATAAGAQYAFQALAYTSDSAPEENPTYSNRIILDVPRAPAPPKRWDWRWLAIPTALVVLAATVVVIVLATRPHHPSSVTMPSVVNTSESAAETLLKEAGLTVTVKHVYDPQTQTGTVVSQKPDAGSTLARGSYVEVDVAATFSQPQSVQGAAQPVPGGAPQEFSLPSSTEAIRIDLSWTQPEQYVASWNVVVIVTVCLFAVDQYTPGGPLVVADEVVTTNSYSTVRYVAPQPGPNEAYSVGICDLTGDDAPKAYIWVAARDDNGRPGPYSEPVNILLPNT